MFWFLLLPTKRRGAVQHRALSQPALGRMARRASRARCSSWARGSGRGAGARGRRAPGRFARVRPPRVLCARLAAGAVHRGVVRDRRRLRGRIYCWARRRRRWPDPLLGIVLAAAPARSGFASACRSRGGGRRGRRRLGLGEEADTPFLDSTVGLIWRALVLWLALLLSWSASPRCSSVSVGRRAPQFQHAPNWPSIRSPHAGQAHDGPGAADAPDREQCLAAGGPPRPRVQLHSRIR